MVKYHQPALRFEDALVSHALIVVATMNHNGTHHEPGVGFVVIVGGETYQVQLAVVTPIDVTHETINDDHAIVDELIM